MTPQPHLALVPSDQEEARERRVARPTYFGGGSWESSVVSFALSHTVKPFIGLWARTPLLPWPYRVADYTGLLLRPEPGTTFERVQLPRCSAEILRSHASEHRVIVYLHGGAFMVGGRRLHRQLMSRLARQNRASVLAVDYRQLPAHPVSASIADALDGYRFVLQEGAQPEDVVIMGDSAGGYLTFQTALEAQEAGLPAPAALVAMSPLIDFDGTIKVSAPGHEQCAIFPRTCFDGLAKVVRRAAKRRGESTDLPASPSSAELRALPPSLIQASTAEMLLPDAVSMASALVEAGSECELQLWDRQVHVFQAGFSVLPEAREALDQIAAFVDTHLPDRPELVRETPDAAATGRPSTTTPDRGRNR